MSTINVNFKVVSVNEDFGVAYVDYWADGATIERFHADIGSYEVVIPPNLSTMSPEEYNNYFASRGLLIVQRQKDAMDAQTSNSTQVVASNIGVEVTVPLSVVP